MHTYTYNFDEGGNQLGTLSLGACSTTSFNSLLFSRIGYVFVNPLRFDSPDSLSGRIGARQ